MRFKLSETSVYHVMSRVVSGDRLLDPAAREVLRKMLWSVADFCGVEVLAYCIMSNHYHVLVRVPEAPESLPREELLRRYGALYGDGYCGRFPDLQAMTRILSDESDEAARWERRLRARMNDVSAFMQTLNLRFSWWYNRTYKRFGTLWAERFKSVLVEDAPAALRVVAAYIDLNPVRAGMVTDPADYRWSSFGEAAGGEPSAQAALANAMGMDSWKAAQDGYRMVLYGKGAQGRIGEQGSIPAERVREILDAGGRVPLSELLQRRIRFLSDGAIFGSEAFVRTVGDRLNPSHAKGKKALGILPVDDEPLCTWRKLQRRAIG